MLDEDHYGDSVTLMMISHMWGVRLTVLNSTTLQESRFRHTMDMEDADLVCVYNGVNHYSAAGNHMFT